MAKSKELIAEIIYYRIIGQCPVGVVARYLNVHADRVNRYTKAYLPALVQAFITDEQGNENVNEQV